MRYTAIDLPSNPPGATLPRRSICPRLPGKTICQDNYLLGNLTRFCCTAWFARIQHKLLFWLNTYLIIWVWRLQSMRFMIVILRLMNYLWCVMDPCRQAWCSRGTKNFVLLVHFHGTLWIGCCWYWISKLLMVTTNFSIPVFFCFQHRCFHDKLIKIEKEVPNFS